MPCLNVDCIENNEFQQTEEEDVTAIEALQSCKVALHVHEDSSLYTKVPYMQDAVHTSQLCVLPLVH